MRTARRALQLVCFFFFSFTFLTVFVVAHDQRPVGQGWSVAQAKFAHCAFGLVYFAFPPGAPACPSQTDP